MSYLQQIIGNNIKIGREAKTLSREELSEKIDISYQYLSQIEAGKNFMKAETMEKLCEALDITPAQLVSVSDNLPSSVSGEIKPLLFQIIRDLDDKQAQALYNLILAFLKFTK